MVIPIASDEIFYHSLGELAAFGRITRPRGRFIFIYMGLRALRRRGELPALGDDWFISTGRLQDFLDDMYTKTCVHGPRVVLTNVFGPAKGIEDRFSTRSGDTKVGNTSNTNTWRNNFNIQKGVGCPGPPALIRSLLDASNLRLDCPHMASDGTTSRCMFKSSNRPPKYRGDEHSIWLRSTEEGLQGVDLNHPAVYSRYLRPKGRSIPVYPFLSVLYSFAPEGFYPPRTLVDVPDFASDFDYSIAEVTDLFDCDPDSAENMAILSMCKELGWSTGMGSPGMQKNVQDHVAAGAVPTEITSVEGNSGVAAEIAVAKELEREGWTVQYFGNRQGVGYDLHARRAKEQIFVEVKSSVRVCTPVLTAEEWRAAQKLGERYVLAVIDFINQPTSQIRYVLNPAEVASSQVSETVQYRLPRSSLAEKMVDASSL